MKPNIMLLLLASIALAAGCTTTDGAESEATEIKLEAKDAILVTEAQLQTDGINIGWWTNTDEEIQWKFDVTDAGEYEIFARISCDPQFPGSVVNVTLNNKTLSFTVPDTGGWENFTRIGVGKVSLSAGSYTIVLKAASVKERFVCNVNYVLLRK